MTSPNDSTETTAPANGPVADAPRATPWFPAEPDWPAAAPRADRRIACGFGLVAAIAVLATPGGYGLSWDEAYYYQPSLEAGAWLGQVLTPRSGWWADDAVTAAFGRIWELPPFVKFTNATGWAIGTLWLDELRAMRLSSAMFFGLTVALVYNFGLLAWGRIGAVASALAFATMPRVFGHAHFAASETTTTCMMLLAVHAFRLGLESKRWAVFSAVAFSLALTTKINAVFLPVVLIPWMFACARRRWIPNALAWALLVPPLTFLFWPWLWHDGFARLGQYIQFATRHALLGLWFLDRRWNFNAPPAPWYYPATMLGVALPCLTVIALLLGIARAFVRRRAENGMARLALWASFVLMGFASAPNTPKYDGMRLFIPAMPYLAVLAGGGVAWVAEILPKRWTFGGRLGWALAALIGLSGIVSIARVHPHELIYYNAFVGGIDGADRLGFESAFWGEGLDERAVADLNRLLPHRARLKTLALHGLCLQILQRWGRLRADILIDPPQPHNAFLLQYRKGFWARFEQHLYLNYSPVAIWSYKDVPLFLLYLETAPPARNTGVAETEPDK